MVRAAFVCREFLAWWGGPDEVKIGVWTAEVNVESVAQDELERVCRLGLNIYASDVEPSRD